VSKENGSRQGATEAGCCMRMSFLALPWATLLFTTFLLSGCWAVTGSKKITEEDSLRGYQYAITYCNNYKYDLWCVIPSSWEPFDSGLTYDDLRGIWWEARERWAEEPSVMRHGHEYRWVKPPVEGVVVGGCVEWVLLARDIAINHGAPVESLLFIGMKRGDAPDGHAVLGVWVGDELMIIDNSQPWPLNPRKVPAHKWWTPVGTLNGPWSEINFE